MAGGGPGPRRRIVDVAAVAFRVLIGILLAVDPVVLLALGDGGAEIVFGGLVLSRPRSPLRGQRLLQPFDALVGAASGCRRRRRGWRWHHANARSVLRQ